MTAKKKSSISRKVAARIIDRATKRGGFRQTYALKYIGDITRMKLKRWRAGSGALLTNKQVERLLTFDRASRVLSGK